jgi:hypothetical protein
MIQITFTIVVSFIINIYTLNVYGCVDWFKKSKIESGSKDCISKCRTFAVDMSTFSCRNECAKFCKKSIKCSNNFWKNKIKTGRPKDWSMPNEKTKLWTNLEKEKLSKVLSIIPVEFEKLSIQGFYRMEKSVQIINPATVAEDGSVVLYDYAFEHPSFVLDRIIIHELAHVLYLSFSRTKILSYQEALGWRFRDMVYSRKGKFLKSDAQDSPEEDFAVNLEYFLFDNEMIKKSLPEAYAWIKKNFPVKLKEVCNEL